MRRALWLALLLVPAGCVGRDVDGGGAVVDPASLDPWLAGDTWTYRLHLRDRVLEDTWTVLGPAFLDGARVVQVQSDTRGPGVDASEVGSFDARTLALRHVDAEDLVLDFDPAEVWLLPAEDRTYPTRITETRPSGTVAARASYRVDHVGEGSVETDAGTFAAHRFDVRKTTFTEKGSSEEASVYWWAPAVMNVVRQDVEGEPVRVLVSYGLAEGPRSVPTR